jgi:membrane peptidoglycan carboxypeptidase
MRTQHRPTPAARRYGRLVAAVTAASLLLSGMTLLAVVPAAVATTTAARELGGRADPLGRLLARPPTRSVLRAADGSVLATLHGDQDRKVVPLSAVPVTVREAVLAPRTPASTTTGRWTCAASCGRRPWT